MTKSYFKSVSQKSEVPKSEYQPMSDLGQGTENTAVNWQHYLEKDQPSPAWTGVTDIPEEVSTPEVTVAYPPQQGTDLGTFEKSLQQDFALQPMQTVNPAWTGTAG